MARDSDASDTAARQAEHRGGPGQGKACPCGRRHALQVMPKTPGGHEVEDRGVSARGAHHTGQRAGTPEWGTQDALIQHDELEQDHQMNRRIWTRSLPQWKDRETKKESSRVRVSTCLQRDSETREYTKADYRLSHNLAPLQATEFASSPSALSTQAPPRKPERIL
jgi:hypothetical protein